MASSFDLNKSRYTHRDYESIKKDLIDAIPSLTQEWTCREESDPGIVLIKLMSMFGDSLSFNMDKIALELYLQTVTQRKNCAMILKLLGYKMHWYRTARVVADVRLKDEGSPENPNHVVLKPFTTMFKGGQITYTVVPTETNRGDIDVNSATVSDRVYLVEGIIEEVSFNKSNLVNNRFYFSDSNIDESNLWLDFGGYHTCKLVDNLYLSTDDKVVSFEFNIDEYDRPYIELVNYWQDILGSSAASNNFNLKYVKTSGSAGSVSSGQLTKIVGAGQGSKGTDAVLVVHPSNNSKEVLSEDGWTAPGYDPQTVEEARKDASLYVTTHETLVSSGDFERATKRLVGVTGAKLVDNEIMINEGLDVQDISNRAKDSFKTQEISVINDQGEEEKETLLAAYCAIIYATYLNLDAVNNMYCQLSESDPYYFKSYDDFISGEKQPSAELQALGCFPYKMTNNLLMSLDELYHSCKVINVQIEYGTTKVYPFKVAGEVNLQEPMSPSDTLIVLSEIDRALEQYYYPDNHDFGDQPKFLDIVKIIQGADDRISYFDAVGQVLEYAPPCNGLVGFDKTSFAIYTGLSSQFNFNTKFLKFRIKNTGAHATPLENLNAITGEGRQYVLAGKSTALVELLNIKELKALDTDLKLNPTLIYIE